MPVRRTACDYVEPAANIWVGGRIPAEFSGAAQWAAEPVLNTGGLLSAGPAAAAVWARADALY